MLWNAAKSYSNRKRTQGKTKQEEIGIKAFLAALLKILFFVLGNDFV